VASRLTFTDEQRDKYLAVFDRIPCHFIEAIPDPPEIDWLWEDYIAAGFTTMLSGHPKSGKTTLLTHVLRAMTQENGGTVVSHVFPARVLVVTEEQPQLWAIRHHSLGGFRPGILRIMTQPFIGAVSLATWKSFIETLVLACQRDSIDLVVFDTLAAIFPLQDENSSVECKAVMEPLKHLNDDGRAVLIVHHSKKGSGGDNSTIALRGSSAISGFVDIIVGVLPYGRSPEGTRARLIIIQSRLPQPPRRVVELSEDNQSYSVAEGVSDFFQKKRTTKLSKVLPMGLPGMTVSEALKGSSYSENHLRKIINLGVEDGSIIKVPPNAPGGPCRYYLNCGVFVGTNGDELTE
jgi:archaellum biogenesis ATPase FlaH